MGILDFFKKKSRSKVTELLKHEIIPSKSNQPIDTTKYFSIHTDIKDLIWIKNGPRKNFSPDKGDKTTYTFNGGTITFIFSGAEEPSLIDVQQEIKEPTYMNKIPAPSYYPSYKSLSPEQKYKYWQFLSNPYQLQEDFSYVFILYYGLERHLFMSDFENAFKTIIKLRDVHNNSSFQSYSGNALVLSCLLHQRADMMQVFLQSLNHEFEKGFSDNLYLLTLHSFDVPFSAQDIMRLSKIFGFSNTNYIKGYPDLFKETMERLIFERFSTGHIILEDFIPHIQNLPKIEMRLFANMSLLDEVVKVPDLISSVELQKFMNSLLTETHELVKEQLAEMRKNKFVMTKKEIKKTTKDLKFDAAMEQNLLNELKTNFNDPVAKHFNYIQLQDFYYKYRDLDTRYIEACISYCYEDIAILDELNNAYIKQEMERYRQIGQFYSKKENKMEIQRIKKEKFNGNIQAFKRLAIIYEKRKEYGQAISISEEAINYYNDQGMDTSDFKKRVERLQKKLE